MEKLKRSLADITWSEEVRKLNALNGGRMIPPLTPSAGEFNEQEVEAIYLYASICRKNVEWIQDKTGRRIGYKYQSSDAWCE